MPANVDKRAARMRGGTPFAWSISPAAAWLWLLWLLQNGLTLLCPSALMMRCCKRAASVLPAMPAHPLQQNSRHHVSHRSGHIVGHAGSPEAARAAAPRHARAAARARGTLRAAARRCSAQPRTWCASAAAAVAGAGGALFALAGYYACSADASASKPVQAVPRSVLQPGQYKYEQ